MVIYNNRNNNIATMFMRKLLTTSYMQICVKAVQQQVDQSRNIQECSVKVSLQPIRLNIDQVHLSVCILINSQFSIESRLSIKLKI